MSNIEIAGISRIWNAETFSALFSFLRNVSLFMLLYGLTITATDKGLVRSKFLSRFLTLVEHVAKLDINQSCPEYAVAFRLKE